MSEVLNDPVLDVLIDFDREQAHAPLKRTRQQANADYLLDQWPCLVDPIVAAANGEMGRRSARLVIGKGQRSTPRRTGASICLVAVDTHAGVPSNHRYHAPCLYLTLTEEETIEARVDLHHPCPHAFAARDLGQVMDFDAAAFRRALADYVAFALRDIARRHAH